ncbi:hypothetical protein [Pseudanabaena sp. PCC 6802]
MNLIHNGRTISHDPLQIKVGGVEIEKL